MSHNALNKIQIPSFVLISLLFILNACYDKPQFPLSPQIGFNDINTRVVQNQNTLSMTDEVTITIDFQDGDGDLGLNEADTLPPFQRLNEDGTPNEFNRNYRINVFEERNGEFVPYTYPDPDFVFGGRFPRLNEENKETPLEGTLSYEIIFQHNLIEANTLLKFEVQILDRALNLSNIIETDTIRVKVQ